MWHSVSLTFPGATGHRAASGDLSPPGSLTVDLEMGQGGQHCFGRQRGPEFEVDLQDSAPIAMTAIRTARRRIRRSATTFSPTPESMLRERLAQGTDAASG